jgi:hypothetical protein
VPVRVPAAPWPRAGLRRPAYAHRAGRFAVMLPTSQVREQRARRTGAGAGQSTGCGAADRRIRLRAPGNRGDDLAGHVVNDRRPDRRGGQCAGTGRVRGGHSRRRAHAHPGRRPLRTGGHCGADDVRSLPGLGLPAETSRAGCDRPARSVSGGVRHRPPPESAPCRPSGLLEVCPPFQWLAVAQFSGPVAQG